MVGLDAATPGSGPDLMVRGTADERTSVSLPARGRAWRRSGDRRQPGSGRILLTC